jgi:hypothetical protein
MASGFPVNESAQRCSGDQGALANLAHIELPFTVTVKDTVPDQPLRSA